MNCVQTVCTPLAQNTLLNAGLDLQLQLRRAKSCLVCGIINSILAAIILFDIHHNCPSVSTPWLIIGLIGIISAVALACFFQYFFYTFSTSSLTVSDKQKKLLNFDGIEKTPVLMGSSNKNNNDTGSNKNVKKSVNLLGSYSSFIDSRASLTWSYNCFTPTGFRCSPHQEKLNNSWNSSITNTTVANTSGNDSYVSPYLKCGSQDFITDKESLQEYLNETTKLEESLNNSNDFNQFYSSGTKNSFWTSCTTATAFLSTSLYQLSPSTPQNTPSKQTGTDENKFDYLNGNAEVLQRISSEKLSHYVANLRMWMSTTILQRLAKEIENIDKSFLNRGYADMRIGNIGLERLKKTVENQQFVNQYMPMLPLILPFLEMSSNQEYLVERIKNLAKGLCIADYRWNSGSSYHGLQWDEHLPSDSAILFHLFCVYLDSQLMPLPQGGGRPFFSRYVIVSDNKHSIKETVKSVHNRAQCAILCSNPMQPKFNFISDKEIHNCGYDRNNFFYVIIQFLLYMKKHQDSCLEGVNLGRSGINIMCVIEN